jgi:hypothetical protein
MHFLIYFAVHVTKSVFLNIITSGLYTSEHYIIVAADTSGAVLVVL